MSQSNKTNTYTEFYYHFFRNILIVTLPLLVISAIVLSSLHSSATNSGSDSVTLTLSTSCTLSSSVITPHNASLNGGQYEEGIGDTRINTYCNDNNGYSIYAIGTSNNADGNTDLVSDLDEHYNIHTGAYVNGNNIDTSTPSFWGMKLTPGVGTGSSSELTPPTIMNSYNSYNVVPSSYTLVASRTSGTNMTIDTDITGSYFNTTYNIYASSVQPAGSYEGRVKYLMVHPNNNSHNTIPDIDAAFATTGKQKYQSIDNNYYFAMQDMTSDICNSVTRTGEATTTQLVDIRDNKLYYVTKLKDGHCWMTQNLDLDLDPAKPLTSNDTDLTDHSLTGAYVDDYNYDPNTGITTWTPERGTIDFQNTTVTGWADDYNNPYSANKTDNTETGHASLGNYYNWTAAIASNNSSLLTQNTLNNIANNPKNSICPKGWRLPTISNESEMVTNSTNEFARLDYIYNNNSNSNIIKPIDSPLYFLQGGVTYNSGLSHFAIRGYYWSSSNSAYNRAYEFKFLENQVLPLNPDDKFDGNSVRCLARTED